VNARSDADLIRDVIARYLAAYEAHDAEGCAAVYAGNGLVLSPWGPPVRGPKAIAKAHLAWFKEGETGKRMTIDDLMVDGDTGFCLLRYSADVPEKSGAVSKVFGASLNTLQRQPDNSWKIRHTSLNELEDGETGFTT